MPKKHGKYIVKEYFVVEFDDEEYTDRLFESIPETWFTDGTRTKCYWPPKCGTKSAMQRAINCDRPDEAWNIYDCVVVSGGYPTYAIAFKAVRDKCSQKYNTSSAEDQIEADRYRRKHPVLALKEKRNFEQVFSKPIAKKIIASGSVCEHDKKQIDDASENLQSVPENHHNLSDNNISSDSLNATDRSEKRSSAGTKHTSELNQDRRTHASVIKPQESSDRSEIGGTGFDRSRSLSKTVQSSSVLSSERSRTRSKSIRSASHSSQGSKNMRSGSARSKRSRSGSASSRSKRSRSGSLASSRSKKSRSGSPASSRSKRSRSGSASSRSKRSRSGSPVSSRSKRSRSGSPASSRSKRSRSGSPASSRSKRSRSGSACSKRSRSGSARSKRSRSGSVRSRSTRYRSSSVSISRQNKLRSKSTSEKPNSKTELKARSSSHRKGNDIQMFAENSGGMSNRQKRLSSRQDGRNRNRMEEISVSVERICHRTSASDFDVNSCTKNRNMLQTISNRTADRRPGSRSQFQHSTSNAGSRLSSGVHRESDAYRNDSKVDRLLRLAEKCNERQIEQDRRLSRLEVTMNKMFILMGDITNGRDSQLQHGKNLLPSTREMVAESEDDEFQSPKLPLMRLEELFNLQKDLKDKRYWNFLVKKERDFCTSSQMATVAATMTKYLRRFISVGARCELTLKEKSESGYTLMENCDRVYNLLIDILRSGCRVRGKQITRDEAHTALRTVWGRSKQMHNVDVAKKNQIEAPQGPP